MGLYLKEMYGNLGGSVRQRSGFQTVVRAPVLVRRFFMPDLKLCSHYSCNYSLANFVTFVF